MTTAYLALGSNLGDRRRNLTRAVSVLAKTAGVRVLACSRVWETDAVGGPTQGRFLNAVVKVESHITPLELLARLQEIEFRLGRKRPAAKWAPRTLDIDILSFGRHRITSRNLTAPHPRMHTRLFVLIPLFEVAPRFVHPVLRKTVRTMIAETRKAIAADPARAHEGSVFPTCGGPWRTGRPASVVR
ncbi:MAG: 2-amino-4-hydroxy-6-hydroxymethyldihydropteridine diphosphokinase [Planctomycetota bacterium]|nr:2-amino-4-hydroxy-6-hydroxymethyldihydropteridine diphosphokinase [Planctomycetota bacterium]